MAGSRLTRLLILLCAAAALSLAGIGVTVGLQRVQEARLTAATRELKIRNLQETIPRAAQIASERDALKSQIAARASRFYAPDEINLYSFGMLVRKKLVALGITVLRYQVVDVKGASYLEFSVSGSAQALVLFLRDVSLSGKIWTIPSLSLTVREGSETADAVFRIGYAVLAS